MSFFRNNMKYILSYVFLVIGILGYLVLCKAISSENSLTVKKNPSTSPRKPDGSNEFNDTNINNENVNRKNNEDSCNYES